MKKEVKNGYALAQEMKTAMNKEVVTDFNKFIDAAVYELELALKRGALINDHARFDYEEKRAQLLKDVEDAKEDARQARLNVPQNLSGSNEYQQAAQEYLRSNDEAQGRLYYVQSLIITLDTEYREAQLMHEAQERSWKTQITDLKK